MVVGGERARALVHPALLLSLPVSQGNDLRYSRFCATKFFVEFGPFFKSISFGVPGCTKELQNSELLDPRSHPQKLRINYMSECVGQ